MKPVRMLNKDKAPGIMGIVTEMMKKALGEMQTLRAGRSKAEPKFFAPPQTPSLGRRMAKI